MYVGKQTTFRPSVVPHTYLPAGDRMIDRVTGWYAIEELPSGEWRACLNLGLWSPLAEAVRVERNDGGSVTVTLGGGRR